MEELRRTMLDVSEMVSLKMEEFHQRLQNVSNASATAGSESTTAGSCAMETCPLAREFEVFRSSVLFCLENLQAQMQILFKMHDEQEMRSRRKFLLLHGVNETKDESSASVTKMMSVLLKLPDVNEDCLSRCSRMGVKRGNKPRPLLVKFHDVEIKDKIWMAKTNLKGTGITLSEFLTKTRHKLFMAARSRFGVSNCWTRGGSIYAYGENRERRRITSMKDIDVIPESVPPVVLDSVPSSGRNARNPTKKAQAKSQMT
ncbi:unnamed protein product [Leptosia nina]|uniref:Uncharacterized protein n=1 Tax=Leptosia nina TaxID=320188 RepID=A0AAV1JBE6_9NEOP